MEEVIIYKEFYVRKIFRKVRRDESGDYVIYHKRKLYVTPAGIGGKHWWYGELEV